MNIKLIILLVVLGLFLTACLRDKTADYSTYSQPQGQQPDSPYVGGGCGVAPVDDTSQPEIIDTNPVF